MLVDPIDMLNKLKVSPHSLGVVAFTDILPNLPPDPNPAGGYATRD